MNNQTKLLQVAVLVFFIVTLFSCGKKNKSNAISEIDHKDILLRYINNLSNNLSDSLRNNTTLESNDFIEVYLKINELDTFFLKSINKYDIKLQELNDSTIKCELKDIKNAPKVTLQKRNNVWLIEHLITPQIVCELFLRSFNKNKYDITKKYVDKESYSFIEFIEQLYKMRGEDPIEKKINYRNIKCNTENPTKCICEYQNDLKTETVELRKYNDKWLVHMTKETPKN
jgi:hypothetical protein